MTELLPLLIASCVRAALPLAAAWALTSLMRRASASTRHFVWTCAIVAAALAPIAALVAPRWSVPVPAVIASFSPDVAAPTERVVRSEPAPSTASGPVVPMAGGGEGLSEKAVSGAAAWRRIDAATLALGVWAIGTAAILLWLSIGAAAARRIRRSASGIEPDWMDEARVLAGTLAMRRPVALVTSSAVGAPIVCGVWRPLIVLPRTAAHWTRDRLRLVVLHELAHVKRRDCLTQALAQIVCAIYWFNPLAWVAARRLRIERERACDDVVLAAGAKGSASAGHLLDIAKTMAPSGWSPAARVGVAMADRSQLEGRLMAILDPATRRSPAAYARHAVAAAVLLVSVPVAAVELTAPVPERADVRLAPPVSMDTPRGGGPFLGAVLSDEALAKSEALAEAAGPVGAADPAAQEPGAPEAPESLRIVVRDTTGSRQVAESGTGNLRLAGRLVELLSASGKTVTLRAGETVFFRNVMLRLGNGANGRPRTQVTAKAGRVTDDTFLLTGVELTIDGVRLNAEKAVFDRSSGEIRLEGEVRIRLNENR